MAKEVEFKLKMSVDERGDLTLSVFDKNNYRVDFETDKDNIGVCLSQEVAVWLEDQYQYLSESIERFVVLWIDDKTDRDENGLPLDGFQSDAFPSFQKAYEQAQEDLKVIEPGREIIIVTCEDFNKTDVMEPLKPVWTNQPERYVDLDLDSVKEEFDR